MPHIIASKLGYFWQNTIFKKIILPFRENVKSPPYIAMSFAVGTFCGLIPCIGQAYICFLFWLFFKKFKYLNFSLLISSALTFVTNPLVMPFVLYGYYSVGETIIGRPSLTFGDFAEEAKHLFENDPNFGSLLKNSLSFFVGDVGKPLAIGSIVCILLSTPIAYLAGYLLALLFAQRRTKTAQKKQ